MDISELVHERVNITLDHLATELKNVNQPGVLKYNRELNNAMFLVDKYLPLDIRETLGMYTRAINYVLGTR